MPNQIQQFFNKSLAINLRATDQTGKVWFVAKDVADALGYVNPSMAYVHCKSLNSLTSLELRDLNKINNLHPSTKWINESDFYRLSFRSDKPVANLLADWVADDVLPSIRKTGSYGLPSTVARDDYNAIVAENNALKTEQTGLYKMVIGLQGQLLALPKPNVLKTGRYSPDEDAIIVEKRAQGCGARTIARFLNRTQDSVAHRFRYVESRKDDEHQSANADIFMAEYWQKEGV